MLIFLIYLLSMLLDLWREIEERDVTLNFSLEKNTRIVNRRFLHEENIDYFFPIKYIILFHVRAPLREFLGTNLGIISRAVAVESVSSGWDQVSKHFRTIVERSSQDPISEIAPALQPRTICHRFGTWYAWLTCQGRNVIVYHVT